MKTNEAESLLPAVSALLEHRIAAAQEAAISKAIVDFEANLRREIALTAMEVSQFYDLRMLEGRIVIEVKLVGAK